MINAVRGRVNAPRAANSSLSTSSNASTELPALGFRCPSPGGGARTTTSIPRIVITRAPLLSFPTPVPLLVLAFRAIPRERGTRNYESVHDRTNRMPRRIGPLRILISIVIKFFVAPLRVPARGFAIKTTMMTGAISVALPTRISRGAYEIARISRSVRAVEGRAVPSFLHLANFCCSSIIHI